MLELRPAKPAELDDLIRILCVSFDLDFELARMVFFEDPLFDISNKWVAVEHGEVVSTLSLVPAPIALGDHVVQAAGISGVATPPGHRRQRYATRLLEECLRRLPERGYVGAALVPFEYDFYRRLGFEEAASVYRATVCPADLPRYTEYTDCRRMNDSDREAVTQIYASHYDGRSGRVLRGDKRWEFILWNNRSRIVWGKPAQSYLFYEMLFNGDERLRIRELGWSSDAGRRGLIGWMAHNDERARTIEMSGWAQDLRAILDSTPTRHSKTPDEPRFRISCHPSFMWRVTDVHQACRATMPRHSGPDVTVQVTDPLLPENARPFRLPDCEPLAGHVKPDIVCDIRTFSQIHIGVIDPYRAYAARWLRASSRAKLRVLGDLFPLRHPGFLTTDQF